ncbi:MAG: hypothetical protein Greene041679_42 [Parcubacteria group bacterium Greene0416_79]|nr:MAG: hypothetical protein Greene041679_42 [Parcubacteria group bacterium Greene0416_79]
MNRFLLIILLSFFLAPWASAFAVTAEKIQADPEYKGAVVPCGYTATRTVNGIEERYIPNPCHFNDVVLITINILRGWLMVGATIATMGFAYAGYLYITAMGSEEKISHAHSIFYKVILGFVFMLGAWLVAYTFERTFLTDEAKKGSFLTQ